MKREIVCIVCPRGCEMQVVDGSPVRVVGAGCKRGVKYALDEFSCPVRTIATSVSVDNGALPLISVRVSSPIPKDQIFKVMEEIKKIRLSAPCRVGDVVIKNVLSLGSDVIVTKDLPVRRNI